MLGSKIPLDLQLIWDKLYQDLVLLDCLRFPRFIVDSSTSASLIVFCDTSQRAYGFVAYIFQRRSVSLVFTKAKVTPLIKRTLHSLELFSVFLAVKYIPSILKVFSTRNSKKDYCSC